MICFYFIVNYFLVLLRLIWILFVINNIWCLLYSWCIVWIYFFGGILMLFLFWIGFKIIVVVFGEIVCVNCLMFLKFIVVVFWSRGWNFVLYVLWLDSDNELSVWLWKLLFIVMILICLLVMFLILEFYFLVILMVVLIVLVLELRGSILFFLVRW